MESVLLTTSASYPDDTYANKYTAVRVDEFYLAAGSAFVSMFGHAGANTTSVTDAFHEREFWAMIPRFEAGHRSFEMRRIYYVAVHECELVQDTLDGDLRDIEFRNLDNGNSKLNRRLLRMVVLFGENSKQDEIGKALHKIYEHVLPINRNEVGSIISVVSTPFKNLSLFNSYSQGIICNVFGIDQCLFLIDVKLTRGCEGSPIFSTRNKLIGFVMNVFTSFKGEWTGFSLAINLYPVIISWLKLSSPMTYHSTLISEEHSLIGNHPVDAYGVVTVSTPYKWGSGVIVNKKNGIVVTCSHVVDFTAEMSDVTVEYKGIASKGEVLYATSKIFPFDVAVIKIDVSEYREIVEFRSSTSAIRTGEAVYVIAYPLFSSKKHSVRGPSVTYGHVSNVYPNIMVLTTCATNSGASGGALVRPNGELLGLVANNVIVPTMNLLIPHITIAIPSSVFLQPVERYCLTNDTKELDSLTTNDKNTCQVWQLNVNDKFMISKL